MQIHYPVYLLKQPYQLQLYIVTNRYTGKMVAFAPIKVLDPIVTGP